MASSVFIFTKGLLRQAIWVQHKNQSMCFVYIKPELCFGWFRNIYHSARMWHWNMLLMWTAILYCFAIVLT